MTVTYDEQVQVALERIEKAQIVDEDTLTLSTGVVLRRKQFPQSRIMALMDLFPYPPIPEVYNKEKDRMEKWDGSEEYQALKQAVDMRRGMAMVDIVLVSGTEVVSIPEGFQTPKDDEWIEELELSHIPVKRESPVARKFAWLKYHATRDENDLVSIMSFATRQLGTAEANVAQQLRENFPDH